MPHSRVPGAGDDAERSVRRAHLDRGAVVGAALAFVDEHGLDGLTMRRLGALMGVEAMSLYHHVTSREALLDAVADRLVEEMATAAALGDEVVDDWRELLARAAHGVRRVALAHPHVFALVASRAPEAPGLRPPLRTMDWTEEFLEALRRRGFGDEGAVTAYRAFTSFLIGHLLLEVAPHLMQADRPPRDRTSRQEDPAAHPTLVRLGASLAADHGVEEFDEALGLLFPGIAAHRAEALRAVGPPGVRRVP